MKKSLADQLHNLGLVEERAFQERKAELALENEAQAKMNKEAFALMDDLDSCKTMPEFKKAARELLLRKPEYIQQVIQKAHRFKGGSEEWKDFIHFFYQVRDGLKAAAPERRETLIKRAFRKHDPKFTA